MQFSRTPIAVQVVGAGDAARFGAAAAKRLVAAPVELTMQ